MYRCDDCGKIFDMAMIKTCYTNYFEDQWTPEDYLVCPSCTSSDYTEVKICDTCFEIVAYDKFADDCTCEACVLKEVGVKDCFDVSCFEEKREIKINNFLACMFEEGDIETILLDLLIKSKEKVDCKKYIEEDKDWFMEKYMALRKAVKK